jgi:hypothetical protein
MSADSNGDPEPDRERDYTVHAVNTPEEGVGLHRLNELLDETDVLEVRVSEPDEHERGNHDDAPMCGEWVRIEYIHEWGAIAPWGRTPDNQFKRMYEWARVLVINHDGDGVREAKLSRDVPQVPYRASGEYEFNIGEYYSGHVTIHPWEKFDQGGMGYDPDDDPVAFAIDAVRAVGDAGAGGDAGGVDQ